MAGYDHIEIEKKAQKKWADLEIAKSNLAGKDPYYLLVEFPYPSGDLHIGHWYAFALTDIFARYKRMQGADVLFPIGFDAFGLPAENAAIRNGVDPKKWTYENMERMRGQLRKMGASFDWSREVATCEPGYYQWTQWLFTKLFEHNLAYRAEASVKWCPKDQTVLANEQVIDGCCERCGTPVEERRLTQWFLRITDYADRLLKDLEPLPWREEIKEAQRAWIGKSEGAFLEFQISGGGEKIKVFTTRPDTIYGATYVVLAPEHPLVSNLLSTVSNKTEVEEYIAQTRKKTERERSENKNKTGVKLEGVSAINPATKEHIPVYIADYVLGSYGTGAVMAVPAHDERDFDFATKMSLPIKTVIEPVLVQTAGSSAFRKDESFVDHRGIIALIKHWAEEKYLALGWKEAADWGTLLTGSIDDGMSPEDTVLKEIREETGYKNSRIVKNLGTIHGRYYHAPKKANRFGHAPAFYVELENEERDAVAEEEVHKHELKWLTLEELKKFLTPLSHQTAVVLFERGVYTDPGILANSGEFNGKKSEEAMWDIVKAVGGERTTQYRLRDWGVSRQRYWGCPTPIVYDPQGAPHAVPKEHLPWILPTDVDFKPNGEHAPLYASQELKERVVKIFGEGWAPEYDTLDTFVDSSWYFFRYLDPENKHDFTDQSLAKKWLPVNRYSGGSEHTTMHLLYARFFTKALFDLALSPVSEPFDERFNRGIILGPDGQKMSKSKGNVINPDDMVGRYGADAVRLYLAFIGPYNEAGSYPWNLDGVASMRKFLERIGRLVEKAKDIEQSDDLSRALAKAAKKVADDAERFKFNTAIAALMSLLNELEARQRVPVAAAKAFVVMLSPFAPHVAEYFFELLGGESSVAQAPWPVIDEALLVETQVELGVQVMGKRRGAITLAPDASEADAVAAAFKIGAVAAALGGKQPSRVIYVAGKVLNLVV